ncbi:MAG: HlyD family type I secretion periplasmic adaptor subunit [Cycloclasticus sp.]
MSKQSAASRRTKQQGVPRARARFLAQAIELEEDGVSDTIRKAIFFSCFLLLASIIWMSVTAVNEMSVSRGEVVPAGYIYNIQHLEGGVVSEVAVHDGDSVKKGDLLVHLSLPATRSEYGRLASRQASLLLSLARLNAIEAGQRPDFGELGEKYPLLSKKQLESYHAQVLSFASEQAVIESQIKQKLSELDRQKNQITSQKKEVVLLEKQVKMRRTLVKKFIVSESELLSKQSDLAAAQSKLASIKDGALTAEIALKEARERQREVSSLQQKDLKLEASDVTAQLAELGDSLIREEDKLKRLQVRAPVSGIIQGLSITGINEVVKPGATIMQVVPVNDDLIVEARVLPSEVGYIQIGQTADVKVDSYDSSRFGSISGVVKQLSPSTYLDEEANPYYRVKIELAQSYVGGNPGQMRVIPGMTVTVDIITGSKTIMEYLIKPVSRGFSSAFKEH